MISRAVFKEERGMGGRVLMTRVQGIICSIDGRMEKTRVKLEVLMAILFSDYDRLPLFLATTK